MTIQARNGKLKLPLCLKKETTWYNTRDAHQVHNHISSVFCLICIFQGFITAEHLKDINPIHLKS